MGEEHYKHTQAHRQFVGRSDGTAGAIAGEQDREVFGDLSRGPWAGLR
jgi:hypothetical protein